ncbi:MAG: hypothetical protein HY553_06670 [Elusimicrobia bacterium]|nr:hypothetical protein [Elusimicrobiota bacterium]
MTPAVAAGAVAAAVLLNTAAGRVFGSPLPPPDELRLTYDDAVRSAGLMSLGMRRLAADIEFIRLLMYYGSAGEQGQDGSADAHAHPEGEHDDGPGAYPQLASRTLRILDLDPWFSYVALYSAAALAFNLDQPDQALAVLRHAAARDPKNWQYRAYVAAIGFSKTGDAAKVHRELEPVVRDPECPTMLKNIVAFLSRRLGRREQAIGLYREILRSRDKNYHAMAEKALQELGAEAR